MQLSAKSQMGACQMFKVRKEWHEYPSNNQKLRSGACKKVPGGINYKRGSIGIK
jgi:hypothetical protein